MSDKISVGAIVVTYNPVILDIKSNIIKLLALSNSIIIVDNSDNPEIKGALQLFCEKININYVGFPKNVGIAKALNIGMHSFVGRGIDWILTMDQDSFFLSNLDGYEEFVRKCPHNVIAIAPVYSYKNHNPQPEAKTVKKTFFWQSGNLVKLQNYLRLGPYKEDYFIDFVDYEYCLRAKKMNYEMFEVGNVILRHNPGTEVHGRFLWWSYRHYEASANRHYFYVRNGLDTFIKYRSKKCAVILLKNFAKVVLLEKEKLKKINYMAKGFVHFALSKYHI